MALGIYSTHELMGVVRRLPQPKGFWKAMAARVYTSDREKIYFDELGEEDRRLAPFVAPFQQGRVLKELGYQTKSFKPAYLKPKGIVHPQKTLMRRPGEAFGGEMSPAQRRDAVIADLLASQRDMIDRRLDWMAAQALMFGSVTVEGDDYPTQTVDFGRDSSLTYTLAGTAQWDDTDADPLGDIKAARLNAYNLGSYPVRKLIFGATAWELFTTNADVKALLSTQVRGSDSNFRAASLNAGEPWAFEGTIVGGPGGQGGYDLYTYQGTYRDDSGTATSILHTNDVIGIGEPDLVEAYGAILDLDSLAPVPMFPKMWRENDPSAEYVMTQSAPLMVPMRPNSTFRIRVA